MFQSLIRSVAQPRLLTLHRCSSSISVLLLDDVENRGVKGEIVKVRRGHARNLLIPKKRAVYVTEANLLKYGYVDKAVVKESREKQAMKVEEALAGFLKDPLVFTRAATAGGALFGSVSVNDVKDYVNRQLKGVVGEVEVEISQAIKQVGQHSIKINNRSAEVIVNPL